MTPLIRKGLIAEASERPADAPQTSDIARQGARRRLTLFAALGIAAYVVALVAGMPAGVIVGNEPWRTGIAGTVWNGEAGIAGGGRLAWQWAPLRSLTSLGFAVDWRMAGSGTGMAGRALVRPSSTLVDAMSGSTDAGVLRAIQPDLPFTCDMTMQADFPRVKLGGDGQMAEGRLLTDPGSCRPASGGAPTAVPALILTAEHIGTTSRLRLAPATQRRRTLMTITLSETGDVAIAMTPEGAAMLPFVGLPPGGSINGRI